MSKPIAEPDPRARIVNTSVSDMPDAQFILSVFIVIDLALLINGKRQPPG